MWGFFWKGLFRLGGLPCSDFSSMVDYELHVGAQGRGCVRSWLRPLVWGVDVVGFDVFSSGA